MVAHTLSPKRIWLIMSGVMLSLLLAALDNTIVGTAMPKIIHDLHGMAHYAWPFTSYMLFSTSIIPISGKLADLYGRKRIDLIGLVVFLSASALCGLSSSMTQLIVFRGLQGIGGGTLVSSAFIIVGEIFPPRQRGKYMGLVSAMFGVASILGPTVGGLITDSLSWRYVFYVNLPFGFIAFFVLLAVLPPLKNYEGKRRLDPWGIVTFLLAVFPLLIGFSEGGKEYPWTSPQIVGTFIFSAIMFASFIYLQTRSQEPLLSLALFKSGIFSVSAIGSFLGSAGMFGAVIFIPLFAQSVLGTSATKSGFLTAPMMLGLVSATTLGGFLVSRFNRYRPFGLTGFFLAFLGMAALASMGSHVSYGVMAASLFFAGAGIGVSMPIFTMASQNTFPARQLGVVTSALQFFRNMGGTVSSAILGSVMLSSMNMKLKAIPMSSLSPQLRTFFRDPKLLGDHEAMEKVRNSLSHASASSFDALIALAKGALAASIQHVFIICACILFAGFILTMFLNERRAQRAAEGYHEPSARAPKHQAEKGAYAETREPVAIA